MILYSEECQLLTKEENGVASLTLLQSPLLLKPKFVTFFLTTSMSLKNPY